MGPKIVPFHYWEENSANWASRLASLKQQGVDEMFSFIPWGLHGASQGIHDFSKVSRLRLEKFLGLAHQAGLTVRATVGFPPRRESLPAWSLALGESSALVPAGLWRAGAEDLSLTRLPSVHDEAFFTPFLEYISDVFALLSLYRFPEGPVVGVNVDWGVYENDLGLTALSSYPIFLQERYPQSGMINLRYHCTFRDYATATSAQGTRVLLDKRPWLAAYDYKYCRDQMLEERSQGISALRTAEPLLDLLSFGKDPVLSREPAPWAIALDATLLEGDPTIAAYPFSPLGLTNPQATGAFRLCEYLRDRAREAKVPFYSMSAQPCPASVVTVIAGKFFSQAQVRVVREWTEHGARVSFPLGLPQYDENLLTIEWKPGVSRLVGKSGPEHLGMARLAQVEMGKGQLWFNESPSAPEPKLWEQIQSQFNGLSAGDSA